MVELLHEYPGGNQDTRCQRMWEDLSAWYAAHKDMPLRTFKNMKVSMFKPSTKPPRLHGTAQEIRSVVPWLHETCCKFWGNGTQHQKTVCHVLTHLRSCYECLEVDWGSQPEQAQTLYTHGKKLFLLYIALEKEAVAKDPEDSHTWRIKPKLHLFQRLCTYKDHNPKDFWCYRDEAVQGDLAKLFNRRGGHDSPGVNAKNCLLHYTIAVPPLHISR